MDFIRLTKIEFYRLKTYLYDIYRFIDAKIMVEQLEKDIIQDIELVQADLKDYSEAREDVMNQVNDATTRTKLENKLTEFEVTLSTDISDEIEQVRQRMGTLDTRRTKSNPPEYHDRVEESLKDTLETMESLIRRNNHIINSMLERLDRGAEPVEVAKELKEFKMDQEMDEHMQVKQHLQKTREILDANSLKGLSGWRKMLSTHVYRSELNISQFNQPTQPQSDNVSSEVTSDFGDSEDVDSFGEDTDFETDSDFSSDFDTDLDEEF